MTKIFSEIWSRAVMTLLLLVLTTATAWAQFVWIGSEGVEQVNTGLDNGSGTSGHWFSYSDNGDGGNSKVVWGVELDYDDPCLFAPVVKACGGISATAALGDGTLKLEYNPYTPFVGVGFNVAGEGQDGDPEPADASAWEGIAIAYTCDVDATLELGLGDVDATIAYANPFVPLPSSTTGNVVRVRWSDFKQPDWYKGTTKVSGEEAACQLVCIKFKVQSEPGDYHFNIYGIGSYDAELPTTPPVTVTEQILMDGDVLTGEIDAPTCIKIADGATVTLKDFSFDHENFDNAVILFSCPGITCLGNATIILEGENYVTSIMGMYPAIQAGPQGTTLTIKGSGSLTAKTIGNSTSIGGANQQDCGDIVIEGGDIFAVGDMVGAGIGSGYQGSCGNITISGGTVEARGGMGGASIGSAYQGSCGNITITDGITKVVAHYSGMAGVYIGEGSEGTCGTVTISSNLEDVVTSGWDMDNQQEIEYRTLQPKNTAIEGITAFDTDGAWYTLTGMKMEGEPTAPGVYVKDGKRYIIR